jgi:uncharacterized membrane protein YkvI
MDIYDGIFLFGALLALCGAIMAAAGSNIPGNFGIPLWFFGTVIMIFGLAGYIVKKEKERKKRTLVKLRSVLNVAEKCRKRII